jgi:hypothetical protein
VLGGNRDGSVDALKNGDLGRLVNPHSVEEIAAGLIDLLRGNGPEMWFDRKRLADTAKSVFGRDAFRRQVGAVFQPDGGNMPRAR